jgi:L,D-transpeptidase YcbB
MRIARRQFIIKATAAVLATQPALALGASRKEAQQAAALAGNTASALSLVDTIEPILSVDTAYNLQRAISNYEQFVAVRGSWDIPTQEAFALKLGARRPAVGELKRRLMINGDMPLQERVDDKFDEALDAAVKLFQARHGLSVSGQVDEATFYALSVPTDYRLNQLRLNLQRIEAMAAEIDDRYVVVNIPAASIEAIEGGAVAQRHTAIVGRIDRKTPILKSRIHQINFNPFWNVPKSIIRKDLIKYMNEDPEYLTKFRIRIYDGSGRELQPTDIDWSTEEAVNYNFRQDPGPENSMGNVKINFPNPHAVYLHDTPTKGLFGENARFYSSGCVRVENVREFVAWVLVSNGNWDPVAIDAVFASGERLDVAVKNPVPIHTTYITAWANRQGTVSFRDDVYQFDAAGKVMFDA